MPEATNWAVVEVVSQHISKAADQVGRAAATHFEDFMFSQLGDNSETDPRWRMGLESPLEAIFYIWWHAMLGEGYYGSMFLLNTQEWAEVSGQRYRLDFVIRLDPTTAERWEAQGYSWPRIAVEVDGHSFHEKTPEQVALRNQRDRDLLAAGWLVLHFSWTEMTSEPEMCIGQVLGVLKDRFHPAQSAVVKAESANKAGAAI